MFFTKDMVETSIGNNGRIKRNHGAIKIRSEEGKNCRGKTWNIWLQKWPDKTFFPTIKIVYNNRRKLCTKHNRQ